MFRENPGGQGQRGLSVNVKVVVTSSAALAIPQSIHQGSERRSGIAAGADQGVNGVHRARPALEVRKGKSRRHRGHEQVRGLLAAELEGLEQERAWIPGVPRSDASRRTIRVRSELTPGQSFGKDLWNGHQLSIVYSGTGSSSSATDSLLWGQIPLDGCAALRWIAMVSLGLEPADFALELG